MRERPRNALAGLALMLVAACSMAPRYRAPPLPVPDVWPIPATTVTGDPATKSATAVSSDFAAAGNPRGAAAAALADVGWRDFFVDARLQSLIAQALANNRDLRIAMLNVERARAQYRIQRANRLPNIDAIGNFNKEKLAPALANGQSTSVNQYYEASVGVSAFEFDLFGRVASLSHAALEQYLAEEASRRSAQLSLIGEVANAYLTLASDRELQRLATGTLKSQQDSFDLTKKRRDAGAASGLDLAQARTTVEAARADAARYDGNIAQDIDALTLLVGATPDVSALPTGFDVETASLTTPPVGLPSAVLLRRPDVVAAEHALRAANANIGAARAAFFPNISLMGDIGSASEQLSGLFKSGTGTWSFAPQITLPIFERGRLFGQLGAARADQDIALARYEKAIQMAFREVADGLALSSSLVRERTADEALAQATASAYQLSQQRYKAGRDSYLNVLDSQRSDYAARQRLIAVRLAEQSNRVNLYKALGGGI
jgi:multidrug efflux system outer membrane protein